MADTNQTSAQGAGQTQLIFPQNQLVTTKLNDSNYLIWKQQIWTTIRGNGLEQYVLEGRSLTQFIRAEQNQQPSMNPDFLIWQRQDQILASWLLSSLSEDVHAFLLNFEARLETSLTSTGNVNTDGTPPTLHTVTQNTPRRGGGNGGNYYARGRGMQFNRGGRGYGRNGFRDRGGCFQSNWIVCQLCQIPGHTSDRCWQRFDVNFIPHSGTQNQQQLHNFSRNPSVNLAQNSSIATGSEAGSLDSLWYPDSGASNHVSNELSNLSIASEYHGGNKLQMGNGSGSNYPSNTAPRDP